MTKLIEVLAGDDAPKVFKLKKPIMTLGSSFECDFAITHNDISRKHIKFEIQGDVCFVTDLGSTNGSYFADQKIIPGQKNEFTKFVSLRLGTDVLITLLEESDTTQPSEKTSDQIQMPPKETESTRVISLSELKQAKTEKLVKQRQTTRAKGKTPPKKAKKTTENWGMIFVVLGVVGYICYEIYNKVVLQQNLEAPTAAVLKPRPRPRPIAASTNQVDRSSLPTMEKVSEIQKLHKCETDLEKYLCQTIPEVQGKNLGAALEGSMIYILMDGSGYLKIAKEFLLQYTLEPQLSDIQKTAGLLFLKNSISSDFNYDLLKERDLSFVFFDSVETLPQQQEDNGSVQTSVDTITNSGIIPEATPANNIQTMEPGTAIDGSVVEPIKTADPTPVNYELKPVFIMSMKSSSMKLIKEQINDTHIEGLKRVGTIIFAFTDEYITYVR